MGAFGASVGTAGTSTLQPPQEEGHSALGFLGNIIGGVKDVTLGLGKLVMAPAADIARGALEAVSFGKIDIPGGYMTPEVVKGLAAMPEDYWQRYSPLLPGGRPASQFLEELYQKPVSFGLDALAAASIAGKAASAAGAGKAAAAGIELAAPETVASELGVSLKTAKQVAVRGALESLPEVPWYTKLLPEEKLVRAGTVNPELIKTSTLRNPLLRAIRSPLEKNLATLSVDDAAKAAISRAEGFGLPMESVKVQSFIRREQEFLSQLPEGARVEKPFIQNLRDTTTATALRNFQSSAWFRDRFKDAHSIVKNWKPKFDAMTPTERAASNVLSMKANVVVKGFGDSSPTNTLDEGAVAVGDTPLMSRIQSEAPDYRQEIDLNGPAESLDLSVDPYDANIPMAHGDTRPRVDKTPGQFPQTYTEVMDEHGFRQRVPGSEQPLDYAYRAVSEADYQRMLAEGKLTTDGRMNLVESEGLVTSAGMPHFYLPDEGQGRILKIKLDEADGWKVDRDGYIKTNQEVPLDRVEGVTDPMVKGDLPRGRTYPLHSPLTGEAVRTAPKPLRTTLDPEVLKQAQVHEPGFDPTPALEFLDEYDNQIIADGVGPGWDVQKLKEESAATRDLLIEETEQIATGETGLQYRGDAVQHVDDLMGRADAIRRFEDSPLEMNERAMRAMMIANGMWDESMNALPDVSLAEAKAAQQAILEHVATKGKAVAERVVETGATGEKKLGQVTSMGSGGAKKAAAAAYPEATILKVTRVGKEVGAGGKGIWNVEMRVGGAPAAAVATVEGGLIAKFMSKGGLRSGQKGEAIVAAVKNELRDVLGDELAEKITYGVTTTKDMRTRLQQVQLNPAVLAGEAWREVRDAMRAHGIQRPGYFPMVDANRVSKMDWLASGATKGMEAALDPHEKWNSGKLLRQGTYIKDPVQARLIRAARHTKADAAVRSIEAVVSSKLGRIVKPGEHLAPDEVGIAIEHVRGINRISKYFYDARLKNLMEGMDDANATLAAIDDTVRNIQDRIAAGELEEGGVTMYAVSKKVADKLNASARASGVINGPYAKIYVQGPMNVWRSMVLAGSPRWIVNNILGNTVFSVMQGAPVARMFHILEGRYAQILEEKKGWKLNWVPGAKSGKTLVGAINEYFDKAEFDGTNVSEAIGGGGNVIESRMAQDPGFIPEAANVAGPGPKIMARTRTLRSVPKEQVSELGRGARTYRRMQKIGDGVRALNSEVETAARMNSALTAAERIQGVSRMKKIMGTYGRGYERMNRVMKDGLTESEAKAVVKEMNHFLGDFTSLSPWERNVMRPYIFPFWGFYKHTAKLLLSYPFEYPERALVLGGLANVTQDMMDAYGPMPEWMAGAMPLAPPGVGPQPFLSTGGPNPFSGLFQSPVSSLSPLIKIPLEHFTGRNLFTGQPFSDKNTITPFGTEQQFKIIRDKNGMPIGTEPVNRVTPSLWEHMLSQIPQYELFKDSIAGGKTFDTSGVIDSFTGKGLIKDPDTGEAKYPIGTVQAVAKFAGFSQMPFDYSAYQSWLGEQQQAALTEALNREGYGAA